MSSKCDILEPCRGSALVATFWLIAVMGVFVFGALRYVALDSQTVSAHRALTQARRLAEHGLAIGMHPIVQAGDPLLRHESKSGAYYTVISAEEGRLNPNTLAGSGDQTVLKRLFLLWGLDPDSAANLAGAIVDWVDANHLTTLNGAEAATYAASGQTGLPFNRPFHTLDELRLVVGMDALERINPQWRDAFTLWTTGQVDVNSASPEVLAAVTGISLAAANRFVSSLAGPDGIRFTFDDVNIPTREEAAARLGMPLTAAPLIQVNGPTRRVDATGQVGNYRRRLKVVTRNSHILFRSELPVPETLPSLSP